MPVLNGRTETERVAALVRQPVHRLDATRTQSDYSNDGFDLLLRRPVAGDTPIVSGDQLSVLEVAGDAARIDDAPELEAFEQALQRVLSDRDRLAAMHEARVATAKSLSWGDVDWTMRGARREVVG